MEISSAFKEFAVVLALAAALGIACVYYQHIVVKILDGKNKKTP
jgi:hypothetical protein